MTDDALMPAGFFGCDSAMDALERNSCTDAWRAVEVCVPKSKAGCRAPKARQDLKDHESEATWQR